jgi:hypothetical protein
VAALITAAEPHVDGAAKNARLRLATTLPLGEISPEARPAVGAGRPDEDGALLNRPRLAAPGLPATSAKSPKLHHHRTRCDAPESRKKYLETDIESRPDTDDAAPAPGPRPTFESEALPLTGELNRRAHVDTRNASDAEDLRLGWDRSRQPLIFMRCVGNDYCAAGRSAATASEFVSWTSFSADKVPGSA